MPAESFVALRCRISRSGFPSERVFRVTLANGAEHIGAAPVEYCFSEDEHPLSAGQPAERLVRMPGFVAARIIERKADGALLVSVPSGEVLLVRPAEVVDYPVNGSATKKVAMFQSNRDIRWAIDCQQLIAEPRPEVFGAGYDETSIDLHLDEVKEAKVWDVQAFAQHQKRSGGRPGIAARPIHLWRIQRGLSDRPAGGGADRRRARPAAGLPPWTAGDCQAGRFRPLDDEGTGRHPCRKPAVHSVRQRQKHASAYRAARTSNLADHSCGVEREDHFRDRQRGAFHFVLEEDDVIAQLTVAAISSPPDLGLKQQSSQTAGQTHVTGALDQPTTNGLPGWRRRSSGGHGD